MMYVNGCSFSDPDNIKFKDTKNGWPYQLASRLNTDLKIDAFGGGSNDRIFRTTMNYLSRSAPEYVIIGFTDISRTEVHTESGYNNITAQDTSDVSTQYYKLYYNEYLSYTEYLNQVICIQNICLARGIKAVFFNSFVSNFNLNLDQLVQSACFDKSIQTGFEYEKNKLRTLLQEVNYDLWLHPYSTMSKELKMYEHDQTGHPIDEGNIIWANKIYEKLC